MGHNRGREPNNGANRLVWSAWFDNSGTVGLTAVAGDGAVVVSGAKRRPPSTRAASLETWCYDVHSGDLRWRTRPGRSATQTPIEIRDGGVLYESKTRRRASGSGIGCTDAHDGTVRWTVPLNTVDATRFVAATDDTYWVHTAGTLLQLRAGTGDVLFIEALRSPPPTCGDTLLCRGALDGELIALDARTAAMKCTVSAPELENEPLLAAVAVADGTALVLGLERWPHPSRMSARIESRLFLLDVATGTLQALTKPSNVEYNTFDALDGTYLVGASDRNGQSVSSSMAAFDANTGAMLWSHAPIALVRGTFDHVALMSTPGDDGQRPHLFSLNARTGDVLWTSPRWVSNAAIADGVAYFIDELEHTLVAAALMTGDELWTVALPSGSQPVRGIVVCDDRIVCHTDAAVMAFSTSIVE